MQKQLSAHEKWNEYCDTELRALTPLLTKRGFSLDGEQVHTAGERYLMVGPRDVGGGGYKLVLLGTKDTDGRRVVIKASSTEQGKKEIETERRSRETVRNLTFAYSHILVPQEILYEEEGGFRIFITEYIEQNGTFLSRLIMEQFSFTLGALKTQESFHATTSSHARQIEHVFGVWSAKDYTSSFNSSLKRAERMQRDGSDLVALLTRALKELEEEHTAIERYCGFLTHADFVPHNFRIRKNELYLLDTSSLHFGNKYESWARFANFMTLYNRPLEEALVRYVRDNRASEEMEAFRLMRIYKLGKLLEYYMESLENTDGDAKVLTQARIVFWSQVLTSLLERQPVGEEIIERYKKTRDSLRSEEERERQKNLH